MATIISAHQRCAGRGFDPDRPAPRDATRSQARLWSQLVDTVAEREGDSEEET